MKYKYAHNLDSLEMTLVKCPCQVAAPRTGLAYRLIWQPADDQVNFIPRPLVPGVPRRIKIATQSLTEAQLKAAENEACDEWAISLYEDPAAARKLCKVFKKLTYTHLAEIAVRPEHGVCTPPDQHTHFNLHEAVDADLSHAIVQVQPL